MIWNSLSPTMNAAMRDVFTGNVVQRWHWEVRETFPKAANGIVYRKQNWEKVLDGVYFARGTYSIATVRALIRRGLLCGRVYKFGIARPLTREMHELEVYLGRQA